MIFSSFTFFIFFTIVILLLVISKNQLFKRVILLVASYFFYGFWDWRFLSLIVISTLVDFYAGNKIYKLSNNRKRNFFLILSICMNLGVLGFFKYFNFFIESANVLLNFWGLDFTTLNILLPVGISFYTFQTMSYTIDIYRKRLKPARNLLEFAIFVAFFPQLVAGPIVRASEFIPQLEKNITIKKSNIILGIQIFLTGLFKKAIIADRLSYFVDFVFDSPATFSSVSIWLAVISYSIQIFLDFSGYSDMAVGIARCLGYRLPINFNMPYKSLNVTEFWKRWHISLSSWLKDYLYISLGGNRASKFRVNVNLMLTMLLGGLWHGASWNFVVWGALHGFALIIHKLYTKRISDNIKKNFVYKTFSWTLTYVFICFTWVFFRSTSFTKSITIITRMLTFISSGVNYIYTPLLLIIPFIVASHIYGSLFLKRHYLMVKGNSFRGSLILFTTIFSLYFLSPLNTSPFIYFQF